MKINGVGDRGRAYPVEKKGESAQAAKPEGARTAEAPDRFELSPTARKIAALVAAANRFPEIREEKVAELTRAIRSGVYNVEPRALARSIMEFEDDLR
jgi:flagellar biosynthesis anti-sigma factor FlgM